VLLYTIFYYRLLGLVIVSGLVVTAALLWVIISALGHTSIAPSFDLAASPGSLCPSVSPSTRTSSISSD